MCLAKEIEYLISNYQQVVDIYPSGADEEKITRAIRKPGSNFDGPIYDMGL